MDAVKFIEEYQRLCKLYVTCSGCPAYDNGRCKLNVKQGDAAAKQVELLEEWATAHPRKTRQDAFLKQYPDAPLSYGIINIKPCQVVKNHTYGDCSITDCPLCRKEFWMQEIE